MRWFACFVGLLALTTADTQGGSVVKPKTEISGTFRDDKDLPKMKLAPERGYVANSKEFGKLWSTWQGNAVMPKVDFTKDIVLVGTTSCAANRLTCAYTLDSNGNLSGGFTATEMGGPGFAWKIVVVPRAAVKTINGKAIDKE